MYYVEMLRVRGALQGWSIAYAIAFIATAVSAYFSKANTHVSSGDYVPFAALFVLAGVASGIVASTLAGNLARENDGHLPLTWTKPASRIRSAAIMAGVDVAGVLAMYVLTIIAFLAILGIVGLAKHFTFDAGMGLIVARSLVFPIATYGLVWALTASMRRKAGAAIGFLWVGMIGVNILHLVGLPGAFGTIFSLLDRIDPMAYMQFHGEGKALLIDTRESIYAMLALLAIGAAGMVAGLAQWRRLEA
jgi:hypothetical protein